MHGNGIEYLAIAVALFIIIMSACAYKADKKLKKEMQQQDSETHH